MVNHILTDIFAHAKMGGSRGFKGEIPQEFSIRHLIKQTQTEKD